MSSINPSAHSVDLWADHWMSYMCSKKLFIEQLDEFDKVVSRKRGVTVTTCVAIEPKSDETPEFKSLPLSQQVHVQICCCLSQMANEQDLERNPIVVFIDRQDWLRTKTARRWRGRIWTMLVPDHVPRHAHPLSIGIPRLCWSSLGLAWAKVIRQK